jgi:hypothetical protein
VSREKKKGEERCHVSLKLDWSSWSGFVGGSLMGADRRSDKRETDAQEGKKRQI